MRRDLPERIANALLPMLQACIRARIAAAKAGIDTQAERELVSAPVEFRERHPAFPADHGVASRVPDGHRSAFRLALAACMIRVQLSRTSSSMPMGSAG